jgi:hypothetical protein
MSVNYSLCLRVLGLSTTQADTPTHYDVLGLDASACTSENISGALASRRRQLRSRLAGPQFLSLVAAFEKNVLTVAANVLSNPDARRAYDESLVQHRRKQNAMATLVTRARLAIHEALDAQHRLPDDRRDPLANSLLEIGIPTGDVETLLARIPSACHDDDAPIAFDPAPVAVAFDSAASADRPRSAAPSSAMTVADRIRAERTPPISSETWLAWGSVVAVAVFTTLLAISATGPTPRHTLVASATDTYASSASATMPPTDGGVSADSSTQYPVAASHTAAIDSPNRQTRSPEEQTTHTTPAIDIVASELLQADYAAHSTIDALCGDLTKTVQAYSLRIAQWSGNSGHAALIAHHTGQTCSIRKTHETEPTLPCSSSFAGKDALRKSLAVASPERLSAIDALATRDDDASLALLLDTLKANVARTDTSAKATVGRTLAALECRSGATIPVTLAALLDRAGAYSAFHIARALSQHTDATVPPTGVLTPVHTSRQRDRCAEAWKRLASQGLTWTPSSPPATPTSSASEKTPSPSMDQHIAIAQQFTIAARCLELAESSLGPHATLTRSRGNNTVSADSRTPAADRLLHATDGLIAHIDGLIQTHPRRLTHLITLDRLRSGYRARLAASQTSLQQIASAMDTLAQLSGVWATLLAENDDDVHRLLAETMTRHRQRLASSENVFDELRDSAWTTLRIWEIIATTSPTFAPSPMLAQSLKH